MIAEYAAHLRRRGLARGSIEKRLRRLEKVEKRIGLCSATSDQLNELLDTLKGRDGRLTAKTRYDWISDLHSFYKWAIDYGHLDHDPTVRVVRPKQRRNLPRPIGTADLAMAIDMAEPTMRAWLCLAAFGGLRCAEIARLECDSWLCDDGLIRVIGKGDKERLVPIHEQVRRTMGVLQLPTRGRTFRRPRGGPFPAAQVSREISLYFQSLGINATAHMLRHWFGTNAYRASKDLRVVQELLGHSSPVTTSIYADWSRPEAKRVVEALELDSAPSSSLFTDWPTDRMDSP